jgi:hypothetical protein
MASGARQQIPPDSSVISQLRRPQVLAHGRGLAVRDPLGGHAHGLDRAPGDQGVAIERQWHQGAEHARGPLRPVRDRDQIVAGQQRPQLALHGSRPERGTHAPKPG